MCKLEAWNLECLVFLSAAHPFVVWQSENVRMHLEPGFHKYFCFPVHGLCSWQKVSFSSVKAPSELPSSIRNGKWEGIKEMRSFCIPLTAAWFWNERRRRGVRECVSKTCWLVYLHLVLLSHFTFTFLRTCYPHKVQEQLKTINKSIDLINTLTHIFSFQFHSGFGLVRSNIIWLESNAPLLFRVIMWTNSNYMTDLL